MSTKIKSGLKINLFNLILLLSLILIFIITGSLGITIFSGIIVIIFVIYSNYIWVFKSDVEDTFDEELTRLGKKTRLTEYTNDLKKYYKSVALREDNFRDFEDDNSRFYDAFELIYKQIKHNTQSALIFLEHYDTVMRPTPNLLIKLRDENRDLINKLNQLVEMSLTIDDSVNNIDTTFVDDLIISLKAMEDKEYE